MGDKEEETDGEEEVKLEVPHVQQKHRWDCGLACSRMVLGFFNKEHADFDEVCKDFGFGDSVWTIDLARIMNHYRIRSCLCTITEGVDKGYSDKSFYKDKFATDEERVNHLFENATSLGLNVQNRQVPLKEILEHLAERKILIALVDWSYLACRSCGISKCLSLPCVGKCVGVFQGHFIAVCGYSKNEKLIYFKNPSTRQKLCWCSMRSFEAARKSYGTDEDLLFLDDSPPSSL